MVVVVLWWIHHEILSTSHNHTCCWRKKLLKVCERFPILEGRMGIVAVEHVERQMGQLVQIDRLDLANSVAGRQEDVKATDCCVGCCNNIATRELASELTE